MLEHGTSSFTVVSGSDENIFITCYDSDTCGAVVDNGSNNTWRRFGDADTQAVNMAQIAGDDQSMTDLKDFVDDGYDPNTHKVQGVVLTDANADMRGTDNANTVVPDAAGTAAGLHTTTDDKIDSLVTPDAAGTAAALHTITDAKIDAIAVQMLRTLGLIQENQYIDTTVFEATNKMTSCRLRIYSVAASVGTDDDVLATYTMTATYGDDGLATYKVIKA